MDDKDVQVAPARFWWVLPVATIGIIVLVGLIGVAIDDTSTVSATGASTTSTSAVLFTTQTTAPFVTSTSEATTSTTTESTATAAPTATTAATTVVAATCRNSSSASCGAFRWDPEPAQNQPITIKVEQDIGQPRAGNEITFTVTGTDPDATPVKEGACGNSTGMAFGDGPGIPTSCSTPCGTARYGPWTPPAPSRGVATFQYRHVYASPGTYTATVTLASGDRCNPYSSVHHLSFDITVTE